ncbi:MAG: smc, partial [Candidatus Aminicenantes bacterium]|nr:smc [Candidatus Aminicenantes bacterium]
SDIERETKRVEYFEETKKRAEADRDELLEDVLLLTREIEDHKTRLSGFEEELGAKRTEVAGAESGLDEARQARLAGAQEIDRLREGYFQALQALTETKNESVKTDKELELLLRQEEKLSAQLGEQDGFLLENAGRLAAMLNDIAGQRALRQDFVSRAEDIKTALGTARASADEARRRLEALKSQRDESAYHLQALRKIDEKGREESRADDVPGGLGILADLIRTSPENARLFDAFWREGARSRVVPAEEFLGGVPEGLRGSYTLVPAAARPAIPADVLSRPGVVGQLKSLIEPDEKLRDRLAGLEDAVIVANVGDAVKVWLEHPELNFLTPSGDLLLASGLMKVGQKAEGVVALAAEMRRLEAEIAHAESESAPLVAEIEEMTKSIEALEAELLGVRDELDRTERVIQDREREHRYGLGDGEKIRMTQAILGRELENLRGEKERLDESLRGAGESLAAQDSEARSLKDALDGKERVQAELVARAAELERRFFETRSGLDLVQEKINGLGEQLRATEKRKEAATAKIELLEADARKSEEDKTRLREEIAELREALESSVGTCRQAEEAAKDERMRHEIRKAEVERDLVNLDEMCWQELKKTLSELRAESREAGEAAPAAGPAPAEEPETEAEEEAEEEAGAGEAGGETGTEAGAVTEAPKPRRLAKKWRPLAEMTDEDVEKELEESRETINRFKAVNLMAEEEYAEQKQRFEFLTQQRQDLRESIHSTEEAIRKIDEESKTQFLKALEEVNKNFLDLFTALFKGGNAEVKLLEPDNPLESGVEIIAQPPGKRVQNLSLLSGGEKSLTSLAFLFALFRYRPSPFCFLDEVDAALDDVNLSRFLDLLKTIKHQTQFILITHNYKTMEVADYIYGTTMAEPNMTRLLSVKLERKGGGEPAPVPAAE